jgi:hypothetical protein
LPNGKHPKPNWRNGKRLYNINIPSASLNWQLFIYFNLL